MYHPYLNVGLLRPKAKTPFSSLLASVWHLAERWISSRGVVPFVGTTGTERMGVPSQSLERRAQGMGPQGKRGELAGGPGLGR